MTDATVAGSAAQTLPAQTLPPRRRFALARRLLRHRSFRIGFALVAVLVLAAALAPVITSIEPTAMQIRYRFRPPSWQFPFGTDMFGRDVFTRVLYGARLSLWIGFTASLLAAFGGALLGLTAAYFKPLDSLLMRFTDALLAFPAILLAISINAALGPQIQSVIIALGAAYVPRIARIVRASGLVIRELDYIDAARVSGAGAGRIILRHMLPNCMAPLLVALTFIFAYAILAEAALSFLGIGPPPPAPSWGNIVSEGRDYSVEAWWIMLFPGLGISLAALGMNLLGDGLRDVLDPRLKIES